MSNSPTNFSQLLVSADTELSYTRTLFIKKYEAKHDGAGVTDAASSSSSSTNSTLFITHIENLSESQLKAVFSTFGEVLKVTIKRFPLRQNSWQKREGIVQESAFAFIVFKEEQSLKRALEKAVIDDNLSKKNQLQKHPVLCPLIKDTLNNSSLSQAALHLKRHYYPDHNKLKDCYNNWMKVYERKKYEEQKEKERKQKEVDEDGFILVTNGFKPEKEGCVGAISTAVADVHRMGMMKQEGGSMKNNSSNSKNSNSNSSTTVLSADESIRLRQQKMAALLSIDIDNAGIGSTQNAAELIGDTSKTGIGSRKKSKKKRSQTIREGFYGFQVKEKRREEIMQEMKKNELEIENFERKCKRAKLG